MHDIVKFMLFVHLPIENVCDINDYMYAYSACVLNVLTLYFQIWPLPLIYMGNLVFGLGGTKKLK